MSKMTAEEFLKKHESILKEALSIYAGRMEENAEEVAGLRRSFPDNKVYEDMENDFYSQSARAKTASNDLWNMTAN